MPPLSGAREHVEAGRFLPCGLDLPALFRRAADIVDKVLRGAEPGDLTVGQPKQDELLINLKTAMALGITIPNSLPARADEAAQ
jgi:putative tryptophan/tyrosine transport system substrate-binding protein